ncbi:serine/threonine-protein kinase [Cellulosimicrobium sp. CUA-896]|uniref:serine/threonine-protein kinase n=1 Tax=Cellulosimicrobium sp. CUA-896 TaxID=1517881 RepID=UPI00111523B4|nr:serine/threonine-protein kinase [Cellulosimicrobium sp. CUA-896]
MKPARGLRLGNRYHLVRRIAVGGMGEVWVAADDALGREVAVKVLRSEYAGNEDFLNRLRTEARNSAALSHPNIAQMYDYGEQERSGYLVMELVVGEPMADLLEREPVLPPLRLLPILSQTARALHAAHVAGVVHRDVKPGNILIDRAGVVKITDFGVSLAANQVPMTATGMVMGTAQYLSPEQAVGQAATGASDVYALGIVAYESVVGNRPFTGSTPVDIAVAHVNEPVPPLPPSVDSELADLIMAMLAKEPSARPRTPPPSPRRSTRSPGGSRPTPGRRASRRPRAVPVARAPRQSPTRRRPTTCPLPRRRSTARTRTSPRSSPRSSSRRRSATPTTATVVATAPPHGPPRRRHARPQDRPCRGSARPVPRAPRERRTRRRATGRCRAPTRRAARCTVRRAGTDRRRASAWRVARRPPRVAVIPRTTRARTGRARGSGRRRAQRPGRRRRGPRCGARRRRRPGAPRTPAARRPPPVSGSAGSPAA